MVTTGSEALSFVRHVLAGRGEVQLGIDIARLERLVELENSPDREVIAERLASLERQDPALARCARRLGAPEALVSLLHVRSRRCDHCRKHHATIGVGAERICAVCFLANS